MLEPYRVILTEEALQSLKSIAHHIRNDSHFTAGTVAESLLDAIDSLESMPARFRRVGTSRKRRNPVHACSVRPFIIYYRIDEPQKAVYIEVVVHGMRRQPRRFN